MNNEKIWIEMQLLRKLNQDSKYLLKRKAQDKIALWVNSTKLLMDLVSVLFSISQKVEEERILPDSSWRQCYLSTKGEQRHCSVRKFRLTSFKNIDAKILNETKAVNQIQ